MPGAERWPRSQRRMERRAKAARRSSRFTYPKTAAQGLHQSRALSKNQNPQNGHLMARFDWGSGAVCFGASPVATVFGSAPGSATPPEHRIHSKPSPQTSPSKQDISTLLGIGHFYFALTGSPSPVGQQVRLVNTRTCLRFYTLANESQAVRFSEPLVGSRAIRKLTVSKSPFPHAVEFTGARPLDRNGLCFH